MLGKPTVKVISICHKPHAEVWKLTSRFLPDFIQANEFIVYVPAADLQYFCEITNPKIRVLCQEDLGESYRANLFRSIDNAGNSNRRGWYLQQFYKIEALLKHSAGADILVIWDADCVPLKDIPLVTSSAKIVYMNVSKEFHKPYFENIHRLLGLNRVQDQTFVIPAFPIRSGWVSDLISFIESKHDCSWADAIIKTTDFSLLSGFSETETLGTWVVNSYPDAWVSGAGKWERLGQSRFGDVRSFNPKKLLEIGQKADLDIVTFERWDKRSLYSSLKRVATKFRTAIKNG